MSAKSSDALAKALADERADVARINDVVASISSKLGEQTARLVELNGDVAKAIAAQASAERALVASPNDGDLAKALDACDRALRVAKVKRDDATAAHATTTASLEQAQARLSAAEARAASAQRAVDVEALRVAGDLATLHQKTDPLALKFLSQSLALSTTAKELLAALEESNAAHARWGAATGERTFVADGCHVILAALDAIAARGVPVSEGTLSVISSECGGPNGKLASAPGQVADALVAAFEGAHGTAVPGSTRPLLEGARAHRNLQLAQRASRERRQATTAPGAIEERSPVVHDFNARPARIA